MSHGEILGVVVAVVCALLLWYELHGPFVYWLLLAAGLVLAPLFKAWIAPYAGFTVDGLGIAGILTIVIGVVFYAEVIKGAGKSKWIPPVAAFAFGVALVLFLGAAGQLVVPSGHVATTSVVTRG